jgi:hypothetical protein
MKNNSVDIQSHSKHTEISSPRKTKTDSDTNNVKMQMFIIFAKIFEIRDFIKNSNSF